MQFTPKFFRGLARDLAIVAAITLAPIGASAVPLTVTAQNSTNVFGTNGHSRATILETSIRPRGVGVQAGGFAVQADLNGTGVEAFTAWRVDIATRLRLPSTYTPTTSPFASGPISATTMANIERLFETGFKTLDLTRNKQSAGFQLALWEVLYETSGTFNASVGNFRASKSTRAINKANLLLAGMSGPVTQNSA